MLKRILFVLLAGIQTLEARSPVQKEYQVKAAFLFNFTHFIEWPDAAFKDNDSAFVIGILGADPFGRFLDEIVHGEKTMGRPIVVKRYTDIHDVVNCQMLFVTSDTLGAEAAHLQNTLTISDMNDFIKEGGMIQFFNEAGKIRFQIDTMAVTAANLEVSSKLLRVAVIRDK